VQIIKLAKPERHYLIALAVLAVGLYFFELGRLPLIGPDEPRYAEVAREMYVSGDWITPRLGRIHWFEKPALLYWMVAASYHALGVSELSTRLSVALAASFGALLLFFFGWRVRSARFGYLSAATLLTSGLWLGFGRAATFDVPLSVAMELALLSFFWWEREQPLSPEVTAAPRHEHRAWWVCCFAVGLAVLAKGLIGLLLPAAIIGSYLIVTRGLGRIFRHPRLLLIGAPIFIATASVWYGPVITRHGHEFINEFFIAHHFQRFLSNKYHHPQPFYFFFAVALLGSFPWSLHLAAGAWRAAKQWRTLLTAPTERLRLFLWLWLLVPIIFFSFSGSKLPGYILPIFPAAALLIGLELERWWSQPPLLTQEEFDGVTSHLYLEELKHWTDRWLRRMWLGIGTALLLLIAAAAVGWRGAQELNANKSAVGVVVAITVAVSLTYCHLLGVTDLFWRRTIFHDGQVWTHSRSHILTIPSGRTATLFLPFGLMLILIVAIHLLLPGLGALESMRELSRTATQAARPGERLVFYINNEQSINFYAPDLPLRDARAELVTTMDPAEIAALLEIQSAPSLLVIALERWHLDVIYDERLDAQILAKQERVKPERGLVLMRVWRRKQVSIQ